MFLGAPYPAVGSATAKKMCTKFLTPMEGPVKCKMLSIFTPEQKHSYCHPTDPNMKREEPAKRSILLLNMVIEYIYLFCTVLTVCHASKESEIS